jgi:hypothetical protein
MAPNAANARLPWVAPRAIAAVPARQVQTIDTSEARSPARTHSKVEEGMTAILHVHRAHMRAMLAVGMTACNSVITPTGSPTLSIAAGSPTLPALRLQ